MTGRRHRLRAVAGLAGLALLYVFVAFIADDIFARYTETGDVTVLAMIMLFAAWAWWYGEDRDRRRALARRSGQAGQAADAAPGIEAPAEGHEA